MSIHLPAGNHGALFPISELNGSVIPTESEYTYVEVTTASDHSENHSYRNVAESSGDRSKCE